MTAKLHKIETNRTHFHTSIENASKSIKPTTHAFGFFILDKTGELTTGISYEAGFTATQLKGSCEHMKDTLMEDIWGDK